MANGGVRRKQRALKSGIYGRKTGQYRIRLLEGIFEELNGFSLQERLTAYQLVGGVMAYQGNDG